MTATPIAATPMTATPMTAGDGPPSPVLIAAACQGRSGSPKSAASRAPRLMERALQSMSRIAARFDALKAENRAAFVPFIMAGDPS